MKNKWKEWLARYKSASSKKKLQYLAMAVIIAVILLIYFSTITGSEEGQESAQTTILSIEEDIEDRLNQVLSKIEGAGQVEVVIYYASTTELVPAFSEDTSTSASSNGESSSSTTSEQADVATVKSGSDTQALIIKEIEPEIKGVVVVAEGAGDIGVRFNLLSAVTTLLDVGADKVEVLKMGI